MRDLADPAVEAPPAGRRRIPFVQLGVAVLAIAALVGLGRVGGQYVPAFAGWVESLGLLGPVVFIAGYVIATVAFIPGLVLTLGAGAIFDILEGTLYVFIGAVLGSSSAFLIARYVARGWITQRVSGHPRFEAIDRAIGSSGRKIVFLLRLSPIFPFNLLNYALGLTRIRFSDYLIASFGMIPATFMYVYLGKAAGSLVVVASGDAVPPWTLWVGLAVTAVVTFLVTRTARRALAAATEGALEESA